MRFLPLSPLCHRGPRRSAQRGMLLLSVALTLGLTAAVEIALRVVQRGHEENRRVQATLERMERIRTAACAYAKLNNSFNLPVDNATPNPNTPKVIANAETSGNLAKWGLSFADTLDGWGRLMTVFSSPSCNLQVDTVGNGSANVNDACLVLVSHGKTGQGAFLPTGGGARLLPLPTDSGTNDSGSRAEWRNTQGNSGTTSGTPVAAASPQPACSWSLPRTDPASPCHFDDIVRHYTAATLCP